MPFTDLKKTCDQLYARYHRRELVHPDPLETLYAFDELRDREIVGIVASSLAYGRVVQILRSVSRVLEPMGASPFEFLMNARPQDLLRALKGFRHRFADGPDMAALLWGVRNAVASHGSLHACFTAGLRDGDENVIPALSKFVDALRSWDVGTAPGLAARKKSHLLPSPGGGSACKRLNLYLRWMARKDEVDPGGWTGVPPSKLVVPLDTHMHRIAQEFNLTTRKQADLKTALEVTRAFAKISPGDPVKYDFALTRPGIRNDEYESG